MTRRKSSRISTAVLLSVFALCAGFSMVRPLPAVVGANTDWGELGAEIEHPFGDRVVKGAPFSAEVIVESTQTLANGSHITNRMTGALYRDSEGRTRQELPRDGSVEIVIINDPVSSSLLQLHMFQHTVRKITYSDMQGISAQERVYNQEIGERRSREREEREKHEAQREGAGLRIGVARTAETSEPERRLESLGIQSFDGVQAEAKRITITVPAGREGNDQPFDIVSETWYSPELQVSVMRKHIDPRMGETVYRLTNINRSEPPRALFSAPPDFSITEEKTEFRRRVSQ